MVLESLNFNYLFAFPATCEHGAVLPIVDIEGVLVKILIYFVTEVALIMLFLLMLLFLMLVLLANSFIKVLFLSITLILTMALIRLMLFIFWLVLLNLILSFTYCFLCNTFPVGSLTSTRVDIGLN